VVHAAASILHTICIALDVVQVMMMLNISSACLVT
jgi:hypothetical protein